MTNVENANHARPGMPNPSPTDSAQAYLSSRCIAHTVSPRRPTILTQPSCLESLRETTKSILKLLALARSSSILLGSVPSLTLTLLLTAGRVHLIASAVILLGWPDVPLAHGSTNHNGEVDEKDDRSHDAIQDGCVGRDVLVAGGSALPQAQPAIDHAECDHGAAEPLVGEALGAPRAGLAEVQVLEEAENGLGGEEDGNNDVADDLVVTARQAERFRQADAQRQTDDDEDDAEDLERGVNVGDFVRVGEVEG